MANVPTGTGESGLDTLAYDLRIYYELRARAIFDSFADVRATRQSHRGSSVQFTFATDMAINDDELDEYTDVDAEALSDSPITVALTEFGRATISTAKLRGTSFIEFDPTAANRLAYNAARSIDLRAQRVLRSNAAGDVSTSAFGGAGSAITTAGIQEVYQQLVDANVMPFADGFYRAVIAPQQAKDLRAEVNSSPSNTWRIPQEYGTNQNRIYTGEIGAYEGFRFIVNSANADAGDFGGTAGQRVAYFLGRECLAKAFSSAAGFGPYPTVRPGPVTDKLHRFRPMGWYWLGNYRHFRDESALWADLGAAP